jgi:uncharacterized protein YigE (DUF2233 family)
VWQRGAIVLLLLLVGCGGEAPPPPGRAETRRRSPCVEEWTSVAHGIEYRTHDCAVHLVRVDPQRTRIDALMRRGRPPREWTFAINANFFDQQLRPLGVVMSNGRQLNPPHPVSWQSVFYVDRNGKPGIVPVRGWKNVRDPVTAVQCGPRLVVAGKRNQVKRAEATWRNGVCIDANRKVVFFATLRESPRDVTQMVELATGGLGCRDAMLFDGGPSVHLYLRETVEMAGDERVPVYLVVAPRSQ